MKATLMGAVCLALFSGLLAIPSPSQAQIFKWENEQGQAFFTDTLSTVPTEILKQNKVETIRGVTGPEPARKAPENQVRSRSPKKETPKEEPEAQAPVAVAKAEDQLPDKVLALLKEAHALLKKDADVREKILKFVEPKEINQKYYIRPLKKFALKKRKLSEKLASVKHPDLSAANFYMLQTAQEDEDLEMKKGEPEEIVQTLQGIQSRLVSEVPAAKKLVKRLGETLEKHKKPEEKANKDETPSEAAPS